MTTLAFFMLIGPRLMQRVTAHVAELLAGIAEARAMAQRYQDLAALTELRARGLACACRHSPRRAGYIRRNA